MNRAPILRLGAESAPSQTGPVQRLGRNTDGYHGETIDITGVLVEFRELAALRGFSLRELPVTDGCCLLTAHRPATAGTVEPRRLYLSAGIHGDEPAGPLACIQLLRENALPPDADLWICPCLNPRGFPINSRTTPEGVDLNRDYNHELSHEVRCHIHWLQELPRFDLTLLLHEDWESNGFYLYELNPDRQEPTTLAAEIIREVSEVCPIETALMIDGRASNGAGVIHPPTDPASRPDWPEAFWLFQYRSRRNFTVEAPSDFPLEVRVQALVRAVHTAFRGAQRASTQAPPPA